jgi:hypothetical protein
VFGMWAMTLLTELVRKVGARLPLLYNC